MSNMNTLLSKFAQLPVNRWYRTEIRKLAQDIRDLFLSSSAVLGGGVVTAGTALADEIAVSATASDLKLAGTLKLQLAALTDVDLLTTLTAVGQAVYLNGTTAAARTLVADETLYVTVIAANTDGAGGITGDGADAKYVAVLSNEGDVAYPTDTAIAQALRLSASVHDGTTGWVRLADILWVDVGGAAWTDVAIVNRDA